MKLLLKSLLPLVVLGLVGGLAVYLIKNREELKPQPREESLPLVEVRAVRPENHRLRVRAQGEVRARTEINLVAEVPGKIVSVSKNFAPGGFFAKGEVLLSLDPRDYEVAVAQAAAALAQARVRLEREEAEAKVAQQEWEALGEGAADPLLLRQPQLAEARAALSAADANLLKARLDLSRCEVRAPFAGRLREKLADVGQYVAPAAALARVYAVDYAEISLPISMDEFAFVNLPLNVTNEVSLPVALRATIGGQAREWSAHVVRTEGAVDRRTRMLNVIARVDDPYDLAGDEPGAALPVGLFVEAEIEGRELTDVYRVPRASLRGRDTVLAVDTSATLRFRRVEIMRRQSDAVLVSKGLQPGDRVIVSVMDAPVDGMSVRIRELGTTE